MLGCLKRPPKCIQLKGSDFSLVPASPIYFKEIHEAIMESLPSLRKHMPWAHLPQSEDGQYRRLIECQSQYFKGQEYVFSLTRQGKFIGSFGLHRRTNSPFGLELGYWVRTTEQNQGFATLGSKLLTIVAFDYFENKRLQICYNKLNSASRRVSEKVGFVREAELIGFEMNGDRLMKRNGYLSTDCTCMDRLLVSEVSKLDWYIELKNRIELVEM